MAGGTTPETEKFQEDFVLSLRQVAGFATIADFRRQPLPLSSLSRRLIASRLPLVAGTRSEAASSARHVARPH
jgi:hypothetical protein